MVIGFTCGAFDLFHAGHNVFLRDCRTKCDKLVVGLHTDPTIDRPSKNKPLQSIYERYTQLINCKWVDNIIPYDTETDLINLMASTPIDVRFLGGDYADKSFTGEQLCVDMGVKVYTMPRKHNFSSSELRERISHDPNTTKPLFIVTPTKSSLF
jgi:glycerol-3-phosphate cytidylyltransferase